MNLSGNKITFSLLNISIPVPHPIVSICTNTNTKITKYRFKKMKKDLDRLKRTCGSNLIDLSSLSFECDVLEDNEINASSIVIKYNIQGTVTNKIKKMYLYFKKTNNSEARIDDASITILNGSDYRTGSIKAIKLNNNSNFHCFVLNFEEEIKKESNIQVEFSLQNCYTYAWQKNENFLIYPNNFGNINDTCNVSITLNLTKRGEEAQNSVIVSKGEILNPENIACINGTYTNIKVNENEIVIVKLVNGR